MRIIFSQPKDIAMIRLALCFCLLCLTQLSAKEPLIIGIAGGTGSGKTTLAEQLIDFFPGQAALINQDAYYKDLSHLPLKERANTNFDHPESLDFDLLREHLIALKQSRPIGMPKYNFHIHSREADMAQIEPADLIIVEGILLFAIPEVRELFDLKIFVDTDDDIRLLRRIERDIKQRSRDFNSVRDQYLKTVKPMHDTFVEPSKRFADVIIPTDRHNAKGMSMIVSKLKEELKQ